MWKNILKDESNDKNWSKFQEVIDKYPSLGVQYKRFTGVSNIALDSIFITWGDGQEIQWSSLVVENVSPVMERCMNYLYVLENLDKDYTPKVTLESLFEFYDTVLMLWTASLKAFDWFLRSVPSEFISSDDNIMYIQILGGTMSVPLTSSCSNSYENDEGVVFNMCLRARRTSAQVIASADNWLSYYLIYSQLAKMNNYEDIESFSEELGLPDVIHQTIRGEIVLRCGNCEDIYEEDMSYNVYEWNCGVCGFVNQFNNEGEIDSEEGIGPYVNGDIVGFDCPFDHRVYSGDATCEYHHIKANNDWPSEGWEHIDFDFQIGDDYFYIGDDLVLNVHNLTEYTTSDYLNGQSADSFLGHDADEYILTEHPDVEEIGEYNNLPLRKDGNYYYYYDENEEIQYSETNPNDGEE
tara:strand:+ start:721 stop:1947 length:1227 start_codon:yes stop_codon:yes gene_type:complete